MGKDWAKRLTAKTDPRVARAAGGHRGLHYRRRGVDPTLSIVWSPDLACALGLIATDGCLSRDGRHIAFVTKDEELMRTWLASIGRSRLRYARGRSATGTASFASR